MVVVRRSGRASSFLNGSDQLLCLLSFSLPLGLDSGGKEDALGLAAPPRVSSNAAPAPDSALSIGPAQPPLPELAKPNQLNDSGGPTDPAPQQTQGQLFPSVDPAVPGVTAGVPLGAGPADTFERRANDEAKPLVVKTGAGSSTPSASRAGPSTVQGAAARPSFHWDTSTRAAAEKKAAALAARNTRAESENRIAAVFAARRDAGLDAKRRRDELEQDQDALNRPRQPKLDERHVLPSHRLDGEGQGLGLFRSASPASPAGDSTSRFDLTNSHRNDATREESILSQDLEQASPDPSDSDEGSKIRPGSASEAHPTHHSRQAQGTLEDPNWALLRRMQDLSAAEREVEAMQMRPEAAIRWVASQLREDESIFGGVGDDENEDEDDQELAGLADEANDEDVEAEQDEEAARCVQSRLSQRTVALADQVVSTARGKQKPKRRPSPVLSASSTVKSETNAAAPNSPKTTLTTITLEPILARSGHESVLHRSLIGVSLLHGLVSDAEMLTFQPSCRGGRKSSRLWRHPRRGMRFRNQRDYARNIGGRGRRDAGCSLERFRLGTRARQPA